MKSITDHSCLGFSNLTIANVPESAEEFDQLAGKTGACLEDAVSNVVYRGFNSDFRKSLAKEIKDQTKFDRLVKKQGPPKKDGTTSPIYESEAEYLGRYIAGRVQAGETKEAVMAELIPLAQSVAKSLAFDPKPSSRSTGPGKEWEAAAQSAFAALGNDPTRIAGLAAKLESLVEGLELTKEEDGSYSVETIARGFKAKAQQDTAALVS